MRMDTHLVMNPIETVRINGYSNYLHVPLHQTINWTLLPREGINQFFTFQLIWRQKVSFYLQAPLTTPSSEDDEFQTPEAED